MRDRKKFVDFRWFILCFVDSDYADSDANLGSAGSSFCNKKTGIMLAILSDK